jgi:hypothetical protein
MIELTKEQEDYLLEEAREKDYEKKEEKRKCL